MGVCFLKMSLCFAANTTHVLCMTLTHVLHVLSTEWSSHLTVLFSSAG